MAQKVLHVLGERNEVQAAISDCEVDEEIDVALWGGITPGDRAKDPYV